MSTEGGTRAVIAALLANLGIAATKFLAFFLTGFSSMLAEAIHSVADSGNQILLLIGGKRSQREATPQHPFGFGRERYVYSFIVSIVLFTLGGCFALYEAWHKFEETRGDSRLRPVRVALVVGAARRAASWRSRWRASASAPRCGSRTRSAAQRSWLRFVRSSKSPELPVILLEDFGALIGLTLALLGVGLMLHHRQPDLRRARLGQHRCAAGGHRGVPRRGDEVAAHRGERHDGAPDGHPRGARGAGGRRPRHPRQDAAPRPRGAARRRQARRRAPPTARPTSPRRSTRPSDGRAMPCPS